MFRLNRVLWPPEKRKRAKCKEQVAKKNLGEKKKQCLSKVSFFLYDDCVSFFLYDDYVLQLFVGKI